VTHLWAHYLRHEWSMWLLVIRRSSHGRFDDAELVAIRISKNVPSPSCFHDGLEGAIRATAARVVLDSQPLPDGTVYRCGGVLRSTPAPLPTPPTRTPGDFAWRMTARSPPTWPST
jgi:hypothetical protein